MTDTEKFEAWFTPKKAEMMRNKIPMLAIIREHQRDLATWQAALASQQPADDAWIEWAGGECPVVEGDIIHVKLRGGAQSGFSVCKPLSLQWEHEDNGWDIIAYRVVKP